MRKFLLAAAATAALAAPAAARDGSPYVGIEGGLLLPKDMNGDAYVDVIRTGNDSQFNDGGAFDVNLRRGWDVDAIAGYDFGAFRLEGELGWKRAKRDGLEPDGGFLGQLNTQLNGTNFTNGSFDDAADGKVSVRSAMVNVLGDFGSDEGMSFYGGVGVGRAWARALNDGDRAWAFQGILGFRTPVSENIDLGLKYRYFRTQRLAFFGGPMIFPGNNSPVSGGSFARITPSINDRFQSHSLLASLIFNFGAPEAEPVVMAPPPPPPPPAPATQTCPDGSVILATDVCPAPPPPPPPMPSGERG